MGAPSTLSRWSTLPRAATAGGDVRAQDLAQGRDLALCRGQGYRGRSRGQDSPALAVLVGLKEKETPGIKPLLVRGPGGLQMPRGSPSASVPLLGGAMGTPGHGQHPGGALP